jgi:hypothetical protein
MKAPILGAASRAMHRLQAAEVNPSYDTAEILAQVNLLAL